MTDRSLHEHALATLLAAYDAREFQLKNCPICSKEPRNDS